MQADQLGWQVLCIAPAVQRDGLGTRKTRSSTITALHVGDLTVRWRCRYTSYGRHFTTKQKLIIVNSHLLPLLLEGDTVVDSSCGANEWVPDLRAACLRVREFTVSPDLQLRCPAPTPGQRHEQDVQPAQAG